MKLIDGVAEKIGIQHARWARKCAQTARTFGASKITRGGGFDRYGDWISPVNGPTDPLADLVTDPELKGIPYPAKRQFRHKIQRIRKVQSTHGLKILQAPSPASIKKARFHAVGG